MKKQKAKKNHDRRLIKILIPIIAGLLVASGIVVLYRYKAATALTAADKAQAGKTYNGVKAVGMVNGEPFFQFDLDVYSAELRAAVAAHYGRKYNLGGMGADFWETKYDGQTPRQFMEKLALNDLVENMVLIQEARKRGIDAPASYHDLESEREAWNAPTDEIVYGPKTLGPAEFNSYRITGIRDDLKTALLKKELAPTVAQMQAAYKTLNDGLKIAPYFVSAVRFYWDEDENVNNGAVRASLEAELKKGASPEAIVGYLSPSIQGLSQEEFDLNSRYVSKEDPYEQGLAANLKEAAVHSCVTGPEDRPELFYITKKEGGHIMPFEEAPGLGRNKWINDQFEIFLQKKVKAARITLF